MTQTLNQILAVPMRIAPTAPYAAQHYSLNNENRNTLKTDKESRYLHAKPSLLTRLDPKNSYNHCDQGTHSQLEQELIRESSSNDITTIDKDGNYVSGPKDYVEHARWWKDVDQAMTNTYGAARDQFMKEKGYNADKFEVEFYQAGDIPAEIADAVTLAYRSELATRDGNCYVQAMGVNPTQVPKVKADVHHVWMHESVHSEVKDESLTDKLAYEFWDNVQSGKYDALIKNQKLPDYVMHNDASVIDPQLPRYSLNDLKDLIEPGKEYLLIPENSYKQLLEGKPADLLYVLAGDKYGANTQESSNAYMKLAA